MLQVMNPRPLQLSHSSDVNDGDLDIFVKCRDSARPLIRELEQTVNFAARKCGDLMQELNFCKEYYEKWATERLNAAPMHKRRTKKRMPKRAGGTRSTSENESEKMTSQEMSSHFNEKLRKKISEITNEIKEANRRIILKEPAFPVCRKKNYDSVVNTSPREWKGENSQDCDIIVNRVTKSEPVMRDEKPGPNNSSGFLKRTPSKVLTKKRSPVLSSSRRHSSMQKYKLRSKSLPQGVSRKFGFGSFVEVVDKQRPRFEGGLVKIKSRTTVSSGSKTRFGRESLNKPKARQTTKPVWKTSNRAKTSDSIMTKRRAIHAADTTHPITVTNSGDASARHTIKPKTVNAAQSDLDTRNVQSYGNFAGDFDINLSSTYISERKLMKNDTLTMGKQRSLIIAPRQPIPFTICRTAKTFNLGLNIQQVLSMIKNKRHSAVLQAIIRDNIRTARSVIRKTDGNDDIRALYIATSSRIAGTVNSDTFQAREDSDHTYSVLSGNTSFHRIKCNMLTCRESIAGSEIAKDAMPIVNLTQVQRPEDVWVVEQPDSQHSIARYRSRCTCFPTKHSLDYHKVLKQYSRMKEREQGNALCSTNFPSRFVTSGSDLYSLPSRGRIAYNGKFLGGRADLSKLQEDFDNLCRRYERVREQMSEESGDKLDADAELNTLEMELTYREEDCKIVLNFYNRLTSLRKKVQDLKGRIRCTTTVTEVTTAKPPRLKRDPFKPTPSMTLTRVLRQIQYLQDKIKLIDSPSITM